MATLPYNQSFHGLNDESPACESPDNLREYLGASAMHHCARAMWYRYRWWRRPKFTPRKLRIFSLGHAVEKHVIEALRAHQLPNGNYFEILDVDPDTRRQFAFELFGGLFKGHCDMVMRGFIECEQWHVGDVKSFNARRFAEWKNKGVKNSDPHYYDQLTMYAGMAGLKKCVLIGYNKDTSEIAYERFDFDRQHFKNLSEKIKQVIESDTPLPRCAGHQTYYVCKMCDFNQTCWGTDGEDQAADRNCRTCRMFAYKETSEKDGSKKINFFCSEKFDTISKLQQTVGCDKYTPIKQD